MMGYLNILIYIYIDQLSISKKIRGFFFFWFSGGGGEYQNIVVVIIVMEMMVTMT